MGATGTDDQAGLTAIDPGSELTKRSVVLAGHRTSVSLEQAFWDALRRIAACRGCSINALVSQIDRERTGNLSSAIRLHVLRHLEAQTATTSS